MYDHLGTHANGTHGLPADQYRQAFGLMQSTKLMGPTFRANRSAISADHLRQYNDIHHGWARYHDASGGLCVDLDRTLLSWIAVREW